jgi:hypothetical protein
MCQLHFLPNRTACISRKTTVLSCHRCLTDIGVEKMNNILIYIRMLTTRCLKVRGYVGFQTIVYIFKACCSTHRYRKAKIDCLSLFMCPPLAQLKIAFFSSFSAAAVYSTNKQTRQALSSL